MTTRIIRSILGGLIGFIALIPLVFLAEDCWNNCLLYMLERREFGIHQAAWMFVLAILLVVLYVGKDWFLKEVK